MEALHQRNLVHRDLKLENALVDEKYVAKLCDLGMAAAHMSTASRAGTEPYMAPEIIDAEV